MPHVLGSPTAAPVIVLKEVYIGLGRNPLYILHPAVRQSGLVLAFTFRNEGESVSVQHRSSKWNEM